jgi:hypothetical protein
VATGVADAREVGLGVGVTAVEPPGPAKALAEGLGAVLGAALGPTLGCVLGAALGPMLGAGLAPALAGTLGAALAGGVPAALVDVLGSTATLGAVGDGVVTVDCPQAATASVASSASDERMIRDT